MGANAFLRVQYLLGSMLVPISTSHFIFMALPSHCAKRFSYLQRARGRVKF